MPRARLLAPHKRPGYWYLARKVPKRCRHLDKRSLVLLITTIAIAMIPAASPPGLPCSTCGSSLAKKILTRATRRDDRLGRQSPQSWCGLGAA